MTARACLTGPWSPDAVVQVAKDVAIPAKTLEISPVSVGADVADLSDHDLIDSTALPESLEGSALSQAIGARAGRRAGSYGQRRRQQRHPWRHDQRRTSSMPGRGRTGRSAGRSRWRRCS